MFYHHWIIFSFRSIRKFKFSFIFNSISFYNQKLSWKDWISETVHICSRVVRVCLHGNVQFSNFFLMNCLFTSFSPCILFVYSDLLLKRQSLSGFFHDKRGNFKHKLTILWTRYGIFFLYAILTFYEIFVSGCKFATNQ